MGVVARYLGHNQDHLINLSFSQPTEAPYEILIFVSLFCGLMS